MNAQRPPHILWVVLDATRTSSCSLYRRGMNPPTTPHLERLAEDSLVYEQAVSCACWTMSSHASMFTGTYPSTHGLVFDGDRLDGGLTPIAETLSRLGYSTLAYSGNPYLSPFSGLDRGFDRFIDNIMDSLPVRLYRGLQARRHRRGPATASDGQTIHVEAVDLSGYQPWFRQAVWELTRYIDKGARRVARHACRRLEEVDREDRPAFIFMHLGEPHAPYLPRGYYRDAFLHHVSSEKPFHLVNQNAYRHYLGEESMSEEDYEVLRALYHGSIAYTDAQLGWLLDRLRRSGILDRTLLIVTADHGENVGEQGMMGHQWSLADTAIHVPLLLRLPGGEQGGVKLSQQVQTSDIGPTLLAALADPLAGEERARLKEEQWEDGTDALPLRPEDPSPHPVAYAELLKPFGPEADHLRRSLDHYDRQILVARTPQWKWQWTSDGAEELYRLDDPRGEDRDCAAQYPDPAAELKEAARPRLEKVQAFVELHRDRLSGAQPLDLDEEVKERLRSLGYIDG